MAGLHHRVAVAPKGHSAGTRQGCLFGATATRRTARRAGATRSDVRFAPRDLIGRETGEKQAEAHGREGAAQLSGKPVVGVPSAGYREVDRRRQQVGPPSRYAARAAQNDSYVAVPGWGHRYEPRPVDQDQIAAFETWCGGDLPAEYRQYLLNVGFGPGPYYGLMSFKQVRDELKIIYEDNAEEFGTSGRPGDPFALEAELTAAIAGSNPADVQIEGPKSPGGFMPICSQGCEFLTVMVTGGAHAGRVFTATAFATVGSTWLPAGRPPGIVGHRQPDRTLPAFPSWPTFTQWVDGWLDQCFADLRRGPAST